MNTEIEKQEDIEKILESIPQSLICRFSTHLTEFFVEDIEIDISTDLDEDALNKIIKNLLGESMEAQNLDRLSFDFLVEGKLLRGKINSHIVRYSISCEKVIEIEYFIAFKSMEEMNESPEEDWVSSLCTVMGIDQNLGILSAMFDGTVSFHKKATKKLAKDHSKMHQDPIKAIQSLPSPQDGCYYTITASLNEDLKVSIFQEGHSFKNISHNDINGHILAIDVNPILDGHFCAAGSEGSLSIFNIPSDFLEEDYNELATSKKKKKKTNVKVLPLITQQNCHSDQIMALKWFNSTQIVTGSADHTIKCIDVEKMRTVKTLLTKDSITTGIDFSNNSFLSSHEDGYIRMWDSRTQGSPTQTFKSHSKYASCVSFGLSSNIFASGSYDQTVKVWDIRSVFPLQSISTDYDKVFTLAWLSESTLASGGSSPFVTFHHT